MKAAVLSSGGIDSTTCLGLAVDKFSSANVITVSIYYGQRHERELEAARAVAEYYHVEHFEFDASPLFKPSDSALLKDSARSIDHCSYAEQMSANHSRRVSTYVPFRNGLMLSMAATFADGYFGGDEPIELFIGVHSDDAAISAYPDCSEAFVEAMARAIRLGTYDRVRLIAPLVKLNKAQAVELGLSLNVPFELTWSCYESGEIPCGGCATCLDRAAAFAANHAVDPAL